MARTTDGVEDVERTLHLYLPAIWMHGGDIRIHDADPESGTVRVELTGMCDTCGLSPFTSEAIQSCLSDQLEWVSTVTVESSGLDPDTAFSKQLTLPSSRDGPTEE